MPVIFTPGAVSLFSAVVFCLLISPAEAKPPVRSLAEIRYEGVVRQKWDLSCGAAALATLLAYDHGDPVPERAVAESMLGRKDPLKIRMRGGFSLLDMQEYVEKRGWEGTGWGELTFQDLLSLAPAIVPLQIHGYDHFVVFRGLQDGDVLLADSSFGRREMSIGRFQRSWERKVAFTISRPAK